MLNNYTTQYLICQLSSQSGSKEIIIVIIITLLHFPMEINTNQQTLVY